MPPALGGAMPADAPAGAPPAQSLAAGPGASRVMASLGDALQDLVGEGQLGQDVAGQILTEGLAALKGELDKAAEVPRLSGLIECYRNCRGQWMLSLNRAEIIEGPNLSSAVRAQIGRLRVVGGEEV